MHGHNKHDSDKYNDWRTAEEHIMKREDRSYVFSLERYLRDMEADKEERRCAHMWVRDGHDNEILLLFASTRALLIPVLMKFKMYSL